MIKPALYNLEHLPVAAAKRIENFSVRLLSTLEENVYSLLVYGSAVGINFDPKTSDVNIAVIVKTLDVGVLRKSLELVAQAKNDQIATPLFLTQEYIRSSSDVFPIEFGEIKNHHIVIFGEDIFSKVEIDPKYVRLFCEAQIKGKILLIRQSYLESAGDERRIRTMLHESLNGLMPIFRQMLIFKGIVPQAHKRELLKQFCAAFALNADHILPIYDDRHHLALIPVAYVVKHLEDYLDLLLKLAHHIDSL